MSLSAVDVVLGLNQVTSAVAILQWLGTIKDKVNSQSRRVNFIKCHMNLSPLLSDSCCHIPLLLVSECDSWADLVDDMMQQHLTLYAH